MYYISRSLRGGTIRLDDILIKSIATCLEQIREFCKFEISIFYELVIDIWMYLANFERNTGE